MAISRPQKGAHDINEVDGTPVVTPMATLFFTIIVACRWGMEMGCVYEEKLNKRVQGATHHTRATMCLFQWISFVFQSRTSSNRAHETRDQLHREQHLRRCVQLDRNGDVYE